MECEHFYCETTRFSYFKIIFFGNNYNKRVRGVIFRCLVKNFDYAKLGSTSSIATAVNSKIIKSIPIGIPNEMIINNYNKRVRGVIFRCLV